MKKIILVIITALLFVLSGCDKKENNNNESTNKYAIVLEKVNNALAKNEANTKTSLTDINNSYVEKIDDNSIKAARAMVYYLELLYKNDRFPITDNPVTFSGDYVKDGTIIQKNDMTMLAKTNNTNLITFDVYGTSSDSSQESTSYFRIDVVFDFETDELSSFNLYIASTDSNEELVDIWLSHKYDGTKLYEFNTSDSSIRSELVNYLNDNYWQQFKSQLPNAITAEGNFAAEYTKATDDVFGDNYFN